MNDYEDDSFNFKNFNKKYQESNGNNGGKN
jgi:hypothetical protein